MLPLLNIYLPLFIAQLHYFLCTLSRLPLNLIVNVKILSSIISETNKYLNIHSFLITH